MNNLDKLRTLFNKLLYRIQGYESLEYGVCVGGGILIARIYDIERSKDNGMLTYKKREFFFTTEELLELSRDQDLVGFLTDVDRWYEESHFTSFFRHIFELNDINNCVQIIRWMAENLDYSNEIEPLSKILGLVSDETKRNYLKSIL